MRKQCGEENPSGKPAWEFKSPPRYTINKPKDHMRTRNKQRREAALERQEAYSKLTPQQKLKKLDAKLGSGVGAIRERAKLHKLINKTTS